MRSRFLVLAAAVAAVALSPGRASAHDLQLVVRFPAGSPGEMVLVTGFDDRTPAEEAKITITDASGTVIAGGKTDERGMLKLPRPKPGNYTATAEAFGHRDVVPFEVAGAADEYRGW